MKKWFVFPILILLLGLYSWFGILVPEKENIDKIESQVVLKSPEQLHRIEVTTRDKSVMLEKKEDLWWVIKPHEYLADQEFVVKAVQIMSETPVVNQFKLEEDRFGFDKTEAFFNFHWIDGLNKRIIVGNEEATANHIYLLDNDSREVLVVHNVWSQLLYYPLERLFSSTLPITGTQVKTIHFSRSGQKLWQLSSGGKKIMNIEYMKEHFQSEKAQWLWFFKKIREFELKNLKFAAQRDFEVKSELEIETEKGNIRFQFNHKGDKIFIPHLNVFADTDPYSLQSLSDEIDKVIRSDKK